MSQNKRVFLVENEQAMREVLLDLFASLGGYEVVGTAATEAQARQWLAAHPGGWDLMLLDLLIDDGSGIAVLPLATAEDVGGRVVVWSEFVTPVIAQRCLRLGAHRALRKSEMPQLLDYLKMMQRG